MNSFDNYQNSIENSQTTSRRTYTLDEDLAIIDMIGQKHKLADISKLTGRSQATLRYRYKSKDRGIRPVFAEKGIEGVYAYHKVDYPGEQDAEQRIEAYKQKLQASKQTSDGDDDTASA